MNNKSSHNFNNLTINDIKALLYQQYQKISTRFYASQDQENKKHITSLKQQTSHFMLLKDNLLLKNSKTPTLDENQLCEIMNIAEEVEHFQELLDKRSNIKNLCKHILNGINQDASWPRFDEYLDKINLIHKEVISDKGLKKSRDVFEKFINFISDKLSRIKNAKKNSEESIITIRLDRALDLVYTCQRSKPSSAYECKKKVNFLYEVLNNNLIPLLTYSTLNKEQRETLQDLIKLYIDAITDLNSSYYQTSE